MAGSIRVYRDDKEKRKGLQQGERKMVCDLGEDFSETWSWAQASCVQYLCSALGCGTHHKGFLLPIQVHTDLDSHRLTERQAFTRGDLEKSLTPPFYPKTKLQSRHPKLQYLIVDIEVLCKLRSPNINLPSCLVYASLCFILPDLSLILCNSFLIEDY